MPARWEPVNTCFHKRDLYVVYFYSLFDLPLSTLIHQNQSLGELVYFSEFYFYSQR